MATVEDELKTTQQASIRLARGTTELINVSGATIATGSVVTRPTSPIDTKNHKRIVARLEHESDFTDGKFTFEFSDTEDFADITFMETVNISTITSPAMVRVGATAGLDETFYVEDMDVESMDTYFRTKVRNDTATTCTYGLNVRAKVM